MSNGGRICRCSTRPLFACTTRRHAPVNHHRSRNLCAIICLLGLRLYRMELVALIAGANFVYAPGGRRSDGGVRKLRVPARLIYCPRYCRRPQAILLIWPYVDVLSPNQAVEPKTKFKGRLYPGTRKGTKANGGEPKAKNGDGSARAGRMVNRGRATSWKLAREWLFALWVRRNIRPICSLYVMIRKL
jgi:hypothetical protein